MHIIEKIGEERQFYLSQIRCGISMLTYTITGYVSSIPMIPKARNAHNIIAQSHAIIGQIKAIAVITPRGDSIT